MMIPFLRRLLTARRPVAGALALLATAACRPGADLLSTPRPAGSTVALRLDAARGDTALLAVHLQTAPALTVSSMTAEVTMPAGWTFIACTAGQGSPLMACKATDQVVRLAAAWVSGTRTGDLLTLQLVRARATAGTDFTLAVSEMHDAIGRSLADSVSVRREVTP